VANLVWSLMPLLWPGPLNCGGEVVRVKPTPGFTDLAGENA
jgi:hypothetical protein